MPPQTDPVSAQAKPAPQQNSNNRRRDDFAAAFGAALIIKGVATVSPDRFGRQLSTLVDGVLAELDRPKGA